jgi:hypothetical protein
MKDALNKAQLVVIIANTLSSFHIVEYYFLLIHIKFPITQPLKKNEMISISVNRNLKSAFYTTSSKSISYK